MEEHRNWYPVGPYVNPTARRNVPVRLNEDFRRSAYRKYAAPIDTESSGDSDTSSPPSPIPLLQKTSGICHYRDSTQRDPQGISSRKPMRLQPAPSRVGYDYPEKEWANTKSQKSNIERDTAASRGRNCQTFDSVSARMETFLHPDCPMRKRRSGPTPKTLAEAGFVFIGPRDRCRCFFSGCGLENWEPTDDPWLEHIRHFQQCKWVILRRGQAFVDDVIQNNSHSLNSLAAHFNDLNVKGPNDHKRKSAKTLTTKSATVSPSGSRSRPSSSPRSPSPSRPRSSPLSQRKQSQISARSTQVQTRSRSTSPSPPQSLSPSPPASLSESRWSPESTSISSGGHTGSASTNSPKSRNKTIGSENSKDKEEDEDNNREKPPATMESPLCKICLTGPLDTLFLPCRHLTTCGICAAALDECPLCGQPILNLKHLHIFSS